MDAGNSSDTAQHAAPHWQRAHERRTTDWPASCHSTDGEHHVVTIVDASAAGFGLVGELPFEVNSVFSISMESIGTFQCRLAWKEGRRAGVQLLDEEFAPADSDRFDTPALLQNVHDHDMYEENRTLKRLLSETLVENDVLRRALGLK